MTRRHLQARLLLEDLASKTSRSSSPSPSFPREGRSRSSGPYSRSQSQATSRRASPLPRVALLASQRSIAAHEAAAQQPADASTGMYTHPSAGTAIAASQSMRAPRVFYDTAQHGMEHSRDNPRHTSSMQRNTQSLTGADDNPYAPRLGRSSARRLAKLYERHKQWQERKAERYEALRAEEEAKKLQECSFQPKVLRPHTAHQGPHQGPASTGSVRPSTAPNPAVRQLQKVSNSLFAYATLQPGEGGLRYEVCIMIVCQEAHGFMLAVLASRSTPLIASRNRLIQVY